MEPCLPIGGASLDDPPLSPRITYLGNARRSKATEKATRVLSGPTRSRARSADSTTTSSATPSSCSSRCEVAIDRYPLPRLDPRDTRWSGPAARPQTS